MEEIPLKEPVTRRAYVQIPNCPRLAKMKQKRKYPISLFGCTLCKFHRGTNLDLPKATILCAYPETAEGKPRYHKFEKG